MDVKLSEIITVTSLVKKYDNKFLALNEIQLIGTHNSYHIAPHSSVMQLIRKVMPSQADAIKYSHRPLTEQLELIGMRKFELDIFHDNKGGVYSQPLGAIMAHGIQWKGNYPELDESALNKPGMKVLQQRIPSNDENLPYLGDTEIIDKTFIDFTHAWYERDDKPPTIPEALAWRDSVIKNNPEIEHVALVHGHVHVPRHQVVENLTVLCQGATGLPFDRDKRGSVAFLTVKENKIFWDVKRFDYNSQITKKRLSDRKPPFYNNLKKTIKFASIRNDL